MIEVDQLVVKYRSHRLRRPTTALDGLDLRVQEGDFFALLGQNGAGKSTAMFCLLGLLRPTAGSVRLFGRSPVPGSSLFRQIGYLPEEPHYHPHLTVAEALAYYAALSGVTVPRQRVGEILERLGMGEHGRTRIARCSKGMKQKVGIAQCLLHAPRLLLLDEPMRGLDPMTVHLFREMLVEANRKGATIVMNSHMLAEVEVVANRVAIIAHGRVIAEDDVSRLVASDNASYVVEIEAPPDDPPLLVDVTRHDGCLAGSLPADQIYPFMDYARDRQLRVLRCALKRVSLEERFVKIVAGEDGHA